MNAVPVGQGLLGKFSENLCSRREEATVSRIERASRRGFLSESPDALTESWTMNRRRNNTTARIFAAFAVMAVLLAASPVVRATKPCPGSHHTACCQTQPAGHGCCDGGDSSHECPSMAACEITTWLPPRTIGEEPTPRGLTRSDYSHLVWHNESASIGRPIQSARSNSLIEQHVRLQI